MSDYNESLTSPPSPASLKDLELTRERGRKEVNNFLERNHPQGDVPGWLACFGARYQGHLVGCVVVGRPVARNLDNGDVIEIRRIGIREDRPANMASWLVARSRKWAALEGYERMITYAGVAGNYGTVYEAAGFTCDQTTSADGSGWTNRKERDNWEDYERRRWSYELDGADLIE